MVIIDDFDSYVSLRVISVWLALLTNACPGIDMENDILSTRAVQRSGRGGCHTSGFGGHRFQQTVPSDRVNMG